MFKPRPPPNKIIKSLVYLVNGSWGKDDISRILEALEIDEFYHQPLPMNYFKQTLLAAEGDIVALATLDDEIINGGTTHLRSLLVGMITGGTKFDNLEDYILDDLVEEEMEKKKKETEISNRRNSLLQK